MVIRIKPMVMKNNHEYCMKFKKVKKKKKTKKQQQKKKKKKKKQTNH